MARIVSTEGRRIYIETRYGEPVVNQLKELGAHWDRERKLWWLGSAKRGDVEQLLRTEGGDFDPRDPVDRAVRADRLEEQGRSEEAAVQREPMPPDDPDTVRLVGKVRYKGKVYFCRWIGQTKRGYAARLVTLPGADGKYLDFWVSAAEHGDKAHDGSGDVAVLIHTYQPREVWDGRRYSGRTRTKYQTLGDMARFLAQQKDPQTRRGQCTECGAWGPSGQSCSECGGEGSYT